MSELGDHVLGEALASSGRRAEAVSYFTAAVDALETQSGRLGGSDEARSSFQARFSVFYANLIELQIEGGDVEAELVTGLTVDLGTLRIDKGNVGVMDLATVARGIGRPINVVLGRDSSAAGSWPGG